MTWTNGDISGSQTLTDDDHLYPAHINELRDAIDQLNNYGFLNVKNYGAIGDGSTDDTAAIQSTVDVADALAETTAKSATIFFPRGTYKITETITSDPSTNAYGPIFVGSGRFTTRIKTYHATANMFDIKADYGGDFYDLYFSADTNRTGGYAIVYSGGPATSQNGHCIIQRNQFYGNMYNAIGLTHNYGFTVSDNMITTTGGIAVRIGNPSSPDTGDGSLYNNNIGGTGGSGVYQTGSGGLRLVNNKINYFNLGYVFDCIEGDTGTNIISNNSIEGFATNGIVLTRNSGSYSATRIQILGNEIWSPNANAGIAVSTAGFTEVLMNNNNIDGPSGTYGIVISNALTNSTVISNSIHNWGTGLSIAATADYVYYGPNAFYGCSTDVSNSSATSGAYSTKMPA